MQFTPIGAKRSHLNQENQLIVDFQRGVVVDSRALNDQQYVRYFQTESMGSRTDMNLRQSTSYWRKYVLG